MHAETAQPLTGNGRCRIKICNDIGRNKMAEPARAKPKPTPETQHFWDGTRDGELRL